MLKKLLATAVVSAGLATGALPALADGHKSVTDDLTWVVTFTINEGQDDALDAVMAKMVAGSRTESGAESYAWFREGDKLHLIETYDVAADAGIHLDNFEANFAEEFGPVISLTGMNVYGPVDGVVRERLAAFGAVFFEQIGGYMYPDK